MSQMRNESSKVRPGKVTPSASRKGPPLDPAQTTAYSPATSNSPKPLRHTTVAKPSLSLLPPATPTTSVPHHTSMRGCAAIASSRIASDRAWEMLTKGGSGERPGSGISQQKSSLSL